MHTPEELAALIAEQVIERLFHNHLSFPSDWNTNDTVTIGEWKAAIIWAITHPPDPFKITYL